MAERLEVVLPAEVTDQHETLLGIHGDHRRHVHAGRGEYARDPKPGVEASCSGGASIAICVPPRDARGSSGESSRQRTRAGCARPADREGPRSSVRVSAGVDRRCRSLSCRGDGRGARIIDLPHPVISRQVIVPLAATAFSPPAVAAECIWPQPEATTATAACAAGDGVSIKGPGRVAGAGDERRRRTHARGRRKAHGRRTSSQGDRELSAQSATYDASERSFEVEGDVEFRSPDLRLKGGSGSWDALAPASSPARNSSCRSSPRVAQPPNWT